MQAKQYRLYNIYVNITQVITSIGIPLLSQLITCEGASQLMLTVVSTHAGIVLALEKALRSQEKYRAYRIAESSALDTWRRMVSMPWTLTDYDDNDEDKDFMEILKEEFTVFTTKIEEVRDFARKIETYAGNKETDDGAAKKGGGNVLGHDQEGTVRLLKSLKNGALRPGSAVGTQNTSRGS